MRAIFQSVQRDNEIKNFFECFQNLEKNLEKENYLLHGVHSSDKVALVAGAFLQKPRSLVILSPTEKDVLFWQDDLKFFLPNDVPVYVLPEMDDFISNVTSKSVESMARRTDFLNRLLRNETGVFLAHATAAIFQENLPQDFAKKSLSLKIGQEFDLDTLRKNLVQLGYQLTIDIEHMGEFAMRGDIVDIYPLNELFPVRCEFFGDELQSIREFDLQTKRTNPQQNKISKMLILPLTYDSSNLKKTCSFLSYVPKDGVIVFDEPMKIRDEILKEAKENELAEDRLPKWSWAKLIEDSEPYKNFFVMNFLRQIPEVKTFEKIFAIETKTMTHYQKQFNLFAEDVRLWLKDKFSIVLCLQDDKKISSLEKFFFQEKISYVHEISLPEQLKESKLYICRGKNLSDGFEFTKAKLLLITEKNIFGTQKKSQREQRRFHYENEDGQKQIGSRKKIEHFTQIHVGDYVVHRAHGIGKYLGVTQLTVDNIQRDYLKVCYAGNDVLFVPTNQVQLLEKFIGSEGATPRLHRMGGADWQKAKAKVQHDVEELAKDLLKLYAKRKSAPGFAFEKDDALQQEFEDDFEFEETKDQLIALQEIKHDMEQPVPMERLLCGDVGFGKTEVAARAAFKAVMNQKQVAFLVPTTVLARQHFQTLRPRFEKFGVNIAELCRFETAAEQKEIIKKLSEGKIDVIIGTHSLLNERVKFKDLGLLVVDEEQRFGVKQKEKIKRLAAGVDVLTLSATPIPRTLNMSLIGARDMSLLETPPADRHPVQTYVLEENDEQIAQAIRRELARNGQIYFIYNRIESIELMASHLSLLVPEAKLRVAHGRMNEKMLEKVMMDFYEHEFDILLATSLVENGLDVANANTMIIYNADHFGLSQLYQMRGRVGRSSRMAFAYFIYQKRRVLNETAEKRLQTMTEFASLGAGFKIAMRDLEIRGAGDLLGAKQSGHMASVGFVTYCQLLEDAVKKLQNQTQEEPAQECSIDIALPAYLNDTYISDAMHKIEIYKKIASLQSMDELKDLLDELQDRFGEPTVPVMNLLAIAQIKLMAQKLKMKSIVQKKNQVEFTLYEKNEIDLEMIAKLKKIFGENLMLLPNENMMRVKFTSLPFFNSPEQETSKKFGVLKFIKQFLKILLKGKEIKS